MGQAKDRGTFEERAALAAARKRVYTELFGGDLPATNYRQPVRARQFVATPVPAPSRKKVITLIIQAAITARWYEGAPA